LNFSVYYYFSFSPWLSYRGVTLDYPEPVKSLTEVPFENINGAYASSTYTGRLPLYAINGAGLIGDAHEASITAKAWHTNDIPSLIILKLNLRIQPQFHPCISGILTGLQRI
jgi:hypothetical protein